jgi:hypothetical protein
MQPFPKLPNQKDYSVNVNYKDRINILLSRIDGDDVKYLAVVSLAEGQITRLVTINPGVMVTIPLGKGEYPLRSAMRMGDVDGKTGINLLRDSVSRLVAAPIDGYVTADSDGWHSVETVYGNSYVNLWSVVESPIGRVSEVWQGPPKGVYSSFSKLEFAKLALIDFGALEVIDSGGYEVAQSVIGVGFDTVRFDNQVGTYFNEKSVARDHPRVSVVNGSGIVGAGTEVARYVHNLGGQVVSISTADKIGKTTKIFDHLGGSALSIRLKQVVRGNVVSDSRLSQADVEIVIGEDAKTWF